MWVEMTTGSIFANSVGREIWKRNGEVGSTRWSEVCTWGRPLPDVPEETKSDPRYPREHGGLSKAPSGALCSLKWEKKIENNTLPAFSSEIAAKICCLDPSVLIPSSFKSPSVSVRKASMSTWKERRGIRYHLLGATPRFFPCLIFSPIHTRNIMIMSY